ncbi:hypothetical protein KY289_030153 [Solanum tuberosum]|nr:hypothetical protein KY289_030153 [Solanum tuberosum]
MKFCELSTVIRARDSTISYEELYEKLLDHELFLKHEEARKPQPPTITASIAQRTSTTPPRNNANNNNRRQDSNLRCQLCDHLGHSAKVYCSQSHNHLQARSNFAARFNQQEAPWIVDSEVMHHIASDHQSLTTMHDYHGPKDIEMGNGNTIPITHTGNANISASNYDFKLLNTLCSPAIKSNLIFDLSTGAPLLRGVNRDGMYKWPPGST